MPMTWDADTDQLLMYHLLQSHEIKVNYKLLADLMGPECTPKAIMHRFSKIKLQGKAAAQADGVSTPPETPKGPKTPRKRKSPTKATTSNEEGEEASSSPKKKRRPATPRKPKVVKAEESESSADGEVNGIGSKGVKGEAVEEENGLVDMDFQEEDGEGVAEED